MAGNAKLSLQDDNNALRFIDMQSLASHLASVRRVALTIKGPPLAPATATSLPLASPPTNS
jgi:hypothetical protein